MSMYLVLCSGDRLTSTGTSGVVMVGGWVKSPCPPVRTILGEGWWDFDHVALGREPWDLRNPTNPNPSTLPLHIHSQSGRKWSHEGSRFL